MRALKNLTLDELYNIRETYSHFNSMSVFIRVIDELMAIREKESNNEQN